MARRALEVTSSTSWPLANMRTAAAATSVGEETNTATERFSETSCHTPRQRMNVAVVTNARP